MYCLKCGSKMTDGARFCQVCGTDMQAAGAQPTQAMGDRPTQAIGQQPTQGYGQVDQTQVMGYQEPYGQARVASDAGYENDPNNPYYYGAPMDEREAKRMANAQVKEAKAAYNDARKAAGKSNAPKVIGIIVALLVVAGVAAGVTWWLMGNNASGAAASSSSSSSSASSSADESSASDEASSEASSAASSEASGAASSAAGTAASGAASSAASAESSTASSAAAGGLASYVGTWNGTFTEQVDYSGHHCYGAEKVPFELTITDVGNSGRVTADMKVLYHGHGRVDQADIQSSNEDLVLEFKGLVGTIDSNGRFEFAADAPEGRGEIKIKFATVDKTDGTRELVAEVKSWTSNGSFTDEYQLVKQ